MASLFDPITIRGVKMRNRLGISPMCMYSSKEGKATDWHLVHLGSRAVGGYGLVLSEATAVEARGRISPDDAGLWEDSQIEPLSRITRFLRDYEAVAGIQLAHAGRKGATARPWEHATPNKPLSDAEGGWEVVAPSPLAFDAGYRVPRALSVEEIRRVQGAFVRSAERAVLAGYEVVELHGAHGYLINEFLSPLTNQREDDYGGTFDNRIRFLREIVAEVRKVLPERLALFVRLSCTDWVEGGWTVEDSVALARRLKGDGVDLIDCSSGAVVAGAKMVVAPGYQVPFAEAVKKGSGILTAAVGMITEAAQAQQIVVEGKADLVLMGRQALRDPYFPVHAARTLGVAERSRLPRQYGRV